MTGAGRTVVLKLGGSLLTWPGFPPRLRAYLDALTPDRPVLIVGGGKGADFIRELDSVHRIGEKRSHELAIRVLDVTARVAAVVVPGLRVVERPGGLAGVWEGGGVPVLAPRWLLENLDAGTPGALPERWDVTTDSIAARAAVLLGAGELRLIKSTGLGGVSSRSEAANRGLVDPYFPTAAAPLERVSVVNLRADPVTTEPLNRG